MIASDCSFYILQISFSYQLLCSAHNSLSQFNGSYIKAICKDGLVWKGIILSMSVATRLSPVLRFVRTVNGRFLRKALSSNLIACCLGIQSQLIFLRQPNPKSQFQSTRLQPVFKVMMWKFHILFLPIAHCPEVGHLVTPSCKQQ